MKRKVIQLAHKTLVVSLPSKWVQNYGVKKGAELDVEERGQQIVFSTALLSPHERVELDFSKLDNDVIHRWVLSSLHKTGYNEIVVHYTDSSVIRVIQDAVRELLIGFVIVEQGRNRCVIRMVAEEQEREFDNMLRRAFLVTKSMGESIYDYVGSGRLGALSELLVLEKTNNQLTNFCERILNKKGYRNDKKRCFVYVVAWNLEKVCDHYRDICRILSESPKARVGKSVVEALKLANDYFGRYYDLYYNFDINKLTSLNVELRSLKKKLDSMIVAGSGGVESLVLCSLSEFVTKVSDFSASFIALNIDAKTS